MRCCHRFLMRLRISDPSFLASFGSPKDARIDPKSSLRSLEEAVVRLIQSLERFSSASEAHNICFFLPFGSPWEAKIDQKLILINVKSKKSEDVNFLHPTLAKSQFLGSNGGRDGGPKYTRNDFLSDGY